MSPLIATVIFLVTIVILCFILFGTLISLYNCKETLKYLKKEKARFNNNNNEQDLNPGFPQQRTYITPPITPTKDTINYEQKTLTGGQNNLKIIKLDKTPEYQTPDGSNILFVVKDGNNNITQPLQEYGINNSNRLNDIDPNIVKKLKQKLANARAKIHERKHRSINNKNNTDSLSDNSSSSDTNNQISHSNNTIKKNTKTSHKKNIKLADVVDRITKLENTDNVSELTYPESNKNVFVKKIIKTNGNSAEAVGSQQGVEKIIVRSVVRHQQGDNTNTLPNNINILKS
ncbi:hypothetical protein CDIK_0329 [Cucumispora dikerogammari]|nr:hypothetical protein CDIK_0329 [Cucumispora dikerogammari]